MFTPCLVWYFPSILTYLAELIYSLFHFCMVYSLFAQTAYWTVFFWLYLKWYMYMVLENN